MTELAMYESKLQIVLVELKQKGVLLDVNDNNSIKAAMKQCKHDKASIKKISQAKKLTSRINQLSQSTETNKIKRLETMDDVDLVLDRWDFQPLAKGGSEKGV
ncbi:hypothetical protein QFW85_12540 [Vibrio chagasii]|uniref:hypothetical protein n=1 Tax=Vibrio chagasii TaxID=170679 RepID=UPI003DAA2CEA